MQRKTAWWKTALSVLIVALIAFYVGARLSEHIRVPVIAGKAPVAEVSDIAAAVFSNFGALPSSPIDKGVGVGAAGIVALGGLYRVGTNSNRRPGEEHGSAGWGRLSEAKRLRGSEQDRVLRLAQGVCLSLDDRVHHRNANVLVYGGSGAGKSRFYVKPNLVSMPGVSFGISDAKQELYRDTHEALTNVGYEVRVFNLIDMSKSDGFNPLRYIDQDAPEASIAQIVESIVSNTDGQKPSGSGEFWDRAERALLTSLIAFVVAQKVADGEEPTLVDVMDLHKRMQSDEGPNASKIESEVDLEMEAARDWLAVWRELGTQKTDPEQIKAEKQLMELLDFATRSYRTYQQGAGETRMSIIISAGVRLAPLDISELRRILSFDSVELESLGNTPTALFLALPDTHQTFRFIAALFWQSLISINVYEADHGQDGRLMRPVHLFLDEFANIGKIPNFPQTISTIRSRRISASVIVQADSQGKSQWRDDWPTITGNCDSTLFLGSPDFETRKRISDALGEETVSTEEHSRSYGMSGSSSRSIRSLKRQLMTPEELGRVDDQEAIVIVRGFRPWRTRKLQPVKGL